MTLVDAPRIVGQDLLVPLVGGAESRYVNLDYAASAGALEEVWDAVAAFLPWYSSVHRGTGYKSAFSTHAFEEARAEIGAFVGARPDDAVIVTRSTTDAINTLSASLPAGTRVINFASEHHANLLPWRRGHANVCLPVPVSPAEMIVALDEALAQPWSGPTLVAVSGASNVTGELWPCEAIADLAHAHGARVFVDAAQLAPHAPIDMTSWDVDYLALSGHKLYAPFGAGALIGRPDWLAAAEPFLAGGGAVRFVTPTDVAWAGLPDRLEAGSPNVVGAIALAAACRALRSVGLDRIAATEDELARYGAEQLSRVPGLRRLRLWDDLHPRIGVLSFTLGDLPHGLVASVLSAEHGVAVRDGCFCAHPYLLHLLDVDECRADQIRLEMLTDDHTSVPGAVRASAGLPTTRADIDALVDALSEIAENGPRHRYRFDPLTGSYHPDPDDRRWPTEALPAVRRPLPSLI